MMVDEADVDLMNTSGGAGTGGRGSKRPAETQSAVGRPNKRRRGPLPQDFTLQRIKSPNSSASSTPNTSPCPSPCSSPNPSTPVASPSTNPSLPESPSGQRLEDRADVRFEASLSRPERPDTPLFQSATYPSVPTPGYSPGVLSVSPPGSPAASPLAEDRPYTVPTDSHPMVNGGKYFFTTSYLQHKKSCDSFFSN